jgi:hypothetical protein
MLGMQQRTRRHDVDTTRFLEYLHKDEATASLADALAELIVRRRAAADRRATATKARAQHEMCLAG